MASDVCLSNRPPTHQLTPATLLVSLWPRPPPSRRTHEGKAEGGADPCKINRLRESLLKCNYLRDTFHSAGRHSGSTSARDLAVINRRQWNRTEWMMFFFPFFFFYYFCTDHGVSLASSVAFLLSLLAPPWPSPTEEGTRLEWRMESADRWGVMLQSADLRRTGMDGSVGI